MVAKEKVQKKSQNNSNPLATEELKDKAFLDAYQKLCDKHLRGITATPALRFNPTSNGFDIVVNLGVSRRDPE